MTSRLLHKSLGSPDYDDIREQLRRDSSVELLPGVRAMVPPLIRRDGRQAIRLDGPPGTVYTLLDGETELDRGTGPLLFVPAKSDPWQLTVSCDDLGTGGETRGEGGGKAQAALTVTPQRRWTVHVVHHSHLDIGYTDPQGTVLRNHLEYLDVAVRLSRQTEDWPDDARFRWTVESAMPALRWLEHRPERDVAAFAAAARAGQLEISAFPVQLHTEACSTDELYRSLRFIPGLREKHGIVVRSAMHTDVPGAVVGVVDALSSAGVRYLSAAHNWAGRSVPYLVGGQELTRPFRWRAPSGAELLVWFTDTPHGMAYMEGNTVGLVDGYDLTLDLLPRYLDSLAHRPYPYGPGTFGWQGPDATPAPYELDILHLRVQGAHADNAGPSLLPAEIVRRWNEEWAWPRLRSATSSDFFEHVEREYGERLPVHEGDWTDWWADGLGSGARPLGHVRRAQNRLRAAETLHALAGPDARDWTGEVDRAYDQTALFNEHTWGAANPWEDAEDGGDSGGLQWIRKAAVGYNAGDDAVDLLQAAAVRFGSAHGGAELASFLVFNPGATSRTDVASAFLPRDVVPLDRPVAVVDARTGQRLEHEEETVDPEDWPTRPIGRHLRVILTDVPGLGYVRLDVVPAEQRPNEPERLTGNMIENEFYRVEFDDREGFFTSIFDKAAGVELINTDAAAGFGQYIHDFYGTAPHVNHLSGHVRSVDATLLGDRATGGFAHVSKVERTPARERIVAELRGTGVDWLRVTAELYAGVKRLDLTFQLSKPETSAKEAVFLAFPFGSSAVKTWELTGGVGGTELPRVPGSATYMLPMRHWVGLEGDISIGWATLEAPLVQLGTIHMPYEPFPATIEHEPGTIYSWPLNNIWDTNFPAQQKGEMTFRYALTSGNGTSERLGAAAAAGLTEPFAAILATGGGDPAPATDRLVTVDHPDLVVTSVGRMGDDLRVRIQSLAAEPLDITLAGRAVRIPARGVTEVVL